VTFFTLAGSPGASGPAPAAAARRSPLHPVGARVRIFGLRRALERRDER